MKLIDQAHPFYQPLWRRILIVAVIAGWLAFELMFTQNALWMTIAGGALAYAVWSFLVTWPRPPQ